MGSDPGLPALVALFISSATAGQQPFANYNQPLARPFTLKEPEILLLESEYGRMTASPGPMSFIFPRPCFSESDSSRVCGGSHGLTVGGGSDLQRLSFSPEGSYAYRHLPEDAHAFELGALVTGYRGPVSLYLDARMYTELHEDPDHPGFDREFVERQDEEASGTVSYSSYSRYRANLDYDFSWGRLSAGRDAVQWGPAMFGNLVFSHLSVPFNQVSFSSGIGPFRLQSLYGQLSIYADRAYRTVPKSRSVYAHRYEWSITNDWLLGLSEQLIVSGEGDPFAAIPIIPLFIFKGDAWEHMNNGNLAADLTWRFAPWGRVYGEFLIDDMQAPTSLFGDHYGNKWGACAGIQAVGNWGGRDLGGVIEAVRIEPWVYTHYDTAGAQSANQEFPLGNQEGPNSLSFLGKAYLRAPRGLEVASTVRIGWKGTDPGSSLSDHPGVATSTKVFLADGTEAEISFLQEARIAFGRASISAGLRIGQDGRLITSVFYRL